MCSSEIDEFVYQITSLRQTFLVLSTLGEISWSLFSKLTIFCQLLPYNLNFRATSHEIHVSATTIFSLMLNFRAKLISLTHKIWHENCAKIQSLSHFPCYFCHSAHIKLTDWLKIDFLSVGGNVTSNGTQPTSNDGQNKEDSEEGQVMNNLMSDIQNGFVHRRLPDGGFKVPDINLLAW